MLAFLKIITAGISEKYNRQCFEKLCLANVLENTIGNLQKIIFGQHLVKLLVPAFRDFIVVGILGNYYS